MLATQIYSASNLCRPKENLIVSSKFAGTESILNAIELPLPSNTHRLEGKAIQFL